MWTVWEFPACQPPQLLPSASSSEATVLEGVGALFLPTAKGRLAVQRMVRALGFAILVAGVFVGRPSAAPLLPHPSRTFKWQSSCAQDPRAVLATDCCSGKKTHVDFTRSVHV